MIRSTRQDFNRVVITLKNEPLNKQNSRQKLSGSTCDESSHAACSASWLICSSRDFSLRSSIEGHSYDVLLDPNDCTFENTPSRAKCSKNISQFLDIRSFIICSAISIESSSSSPSSTLAMTSTSCDATVGSSVVRSLNCEVGAQCTILRIKFKLDFRIARIIVC